MSEEDPTLELVFEGHRRRQEAKEEKEGLNHKKTLNKLFQNLFQGDYMAIKKTPVEDFTNEYAKHLLAHKWAPDQLGLDLEPIATPATKVFFEHAKAKGWISKRDGKVLSTGYKTAAAFLRR